MRLRWLFAPGVAAAAAMVAFACKSSPTSTDPCGSGPAPSIVGLYQLYQYKVGTQNWTAPPASGSLTLTDTTYAMNLVLPISGLPDSLVSDSGHYYVTGRACITQYSSVDTTHFSGTFTLSTSTSGVTTLRATGTNGSEPVTAAWTKII